LPVNIRGMKRSGSRNKNGITWPRGFRAAGATCGIKPSGEADLTLIAADVPCAAAGVFTKSKVPGAPVVVSRNRLRNRDHMRAIVVNSGCSNVCTGKQGITDAKLMCQLTADMVGCSEQEVLVCSTGVIGQLLPMDKIRRGIETAGHRLTTGSRANGAAARGILTTDLCTKSASGSFRLNGKTVRLSGIAKGSGMIAPNMATMLAFITTDVSISPKLLRQALRHASNHSFNRISIDLDTSTSDTVLVLASGKSGNRKISTTGKAFKQFQDALTEICKDLAYQIVKDGEGATKVFRVVVRRAASIRDADRVGYTAVGSPLVKTAVHGGDPNWGRLAMAVGRSGARVKPEKLNIRIGDIDTCVNGKPTELSRGQMKQLVRTMSKRDITITIDLQNGRHEAEWLGCDLSRQYVMINADYTT